MSANLRAYTKTIYGFDHVMRLVPHDAWSNASPCEGWTARDVVGHVIAVQRYIESLIVGAEPPMNPYEHPGRFAGDDPLTTWTATRDDLLALLDEPHIVHRTVQSWRGEEEIDAVIGWNVVDTLTHAWDLGRAAGVDDQLDPSSVAHALKHAAPMIEHMRKPPYFGDAVSIAGNDDEGAEPQTQLLIMLGRRP